MVGVTMTHSARFNVKREERSKTMRRMIGIATFLLLFVANAYGADVESRLPAGTSERIKASIREVIRTGVDPDEVAALTIRMEENRFSERLTIRAHEIIMAAKQEGLPVAPIVSKAYEGIAKRVEAERTLQAMDAVRSRYSTAFRTAARTLTADEKQQQVLGRIVAEGLAAGIREREMDRITENLREHNRWMNRSERAELAVQSFQTVRDMARLGVPSITVADVVCQALKHQFTALEMVQMRNAFTAETRYGKPDSVAQRYGAQIGAGMRAEGLGKAGEGFTGGSTSGTSSGGSGSSGSAGGNSGAGSGGSGSSGGDGGSGNAGGAGGSGGSGGGGRR
jgi:hypothetical protein